MGAGADFVSDRVLKSYYFKTESIDLIRNLDSDLKAPIQTLEIAFDRLCNMSCMYCSPSFSSKWVKDIRSNGSYEGLKTDIDHHYISDHSNADRDEENNNIFTNSFWQAWSSIVGRLKRIKVTGGEPFLSPQFWRLVESFKDYDVEKLTVAINSNLFVPTHNLERFFLNTESVKDIEVYTNCESFGRNAEYIRHGLDWELWQRNFNLACENSRVSKAVVNCTVNILSLFKLKELLVYIVNSNLEERRERSSEKFYESKSAFSINILRNPHFQSVAILPSVMRVKYAKELEGFLREYQGLLNRFEKNQVDRFIHYLYKVEKHPLSKFSNEELARDLKSFVTQYDERRNKSYKTIFPIEFRDWIDSL